jgi:predicted ATPase
MLAAALPLTEDPAALIELHTLRHAALFRLGRLEEADQVYETLISLSAGPYDRIEATAVQISRFTNRNRHGDAIALGLDLLRHLGWTIPMPDDVNAEIDRGLDWCARWIDETSQADDLRRPNVTDPANLAAGTLIRKMMPALFLRNDATMAWLALAAAHVWADSGPTDTMIGAVCQVPLLLIARRQDYRTGKRLMRRLLAVGEERGFELSTSLARNVYAVDLCHWFEPVEKDECHGMQARESLVRYGDLEGACDTYIGPVFNMDLANTLGEYAGVVDAALTFAERTGNRRAIDVFQPYRWLAAALRG